MEKILRTIEKFIPRRLYRFFQPAYHYILAICGALIYRFPSKKIFVVGVTGTKGKSTTVELVNSILEEAGYKTSLLSTIRFKLGGKSEPNMYKMTIPGRFFVQKFLRDAVNHGSSHVVLELTSEGAKQFRHKFIDLNALIVTNLTPEHIESHGSFENYKDAKLSLVRALENSKKRPRTLVVNFDMEHAKDFLKASVEKKITFSLLEAKPYESKEVGTDFVFEGIKIKTSLPGEFNLSNILASITFGKSQNIPIEKIKKAIEKFKSIRGRLERVIAGQNFEVIVDYAHTADSMEKVYKIFENKRKICIFGATGGGRDKWKRPVMGQVADKYCGEIILTDDDSYDEKPEQICEEIKKGIKNKTPKILINRREAIKMGLSLAKSGDVVLITGKGTDPFIMGPRGTKTSWDDATVAREEIIKIKNG